MPLNVQTANEVEDPNKKKFLGLGQQPGTAQQFDPSSAFGAAATISPIGPPVAIRDTSALQFNPEFASRNVGLQRQEADLALQRQQQVGQVGQEYERQVGRANQDQEMARQKLLEKMSGQGILSSGITGQQGSQLQSAFQRFMDDLSYNKARGIAGVESNYANAMNQIAGQREGLFGEQQQVEEQRRLERARAEAEAQRLAQEQAMNAQLIAQQQQMQQQQAAQQAALLAAMQPPQIIYSGGGGGGGGGYSAPAPQPAGPNWGAQAAKFDDLVNWANQQRSAHKGNKANFDADTSALINRDPNWAGSVMNAMGSYFGGAQSLQDVLDWLWMPTGPLIQSRPGLNTNMGVL